MKNGVFVAHRLMILQSSDRERKERVLMANLLEQTVDGLRTSQWVVREKENHIFLFPSIFFPMKS